MFLVLFLVAGDVMKEFLESESRHAGRQPMTAFYRVARLPEVAKRGKGKSERDPRGAASRCTR